MFPSFGPPLIEIEAIIELRDLLTTLHGSATCAKASLKLPKEVNNEATAAVQITEHAVQPATAEAAIGETATREAKRADHGTGRAITKGSQHKSVRSNRRGK